MLRFFLGNGVSAFSGLSRLLGGGGGGGGGGVVFAWRVAPTLSANVGW